MKDNTTHAVKKLLLPRSVVGRFKRALADLEEQRGHSISFNAGAAEAFEQFVQMHEARKVAP